MKFLHIADLHLGKRMNDINLLEDQIFALNQVVEIAKEEKVDAVLAAGDIYQQSSPRSEAMTAFNDFVCALVDAGIKVFAISGNHDSDRRVSYFSSLVRSSGVYVSEKFEGTLQKYTFSDEYGDVVISLLPFIRPVNVRKLFPEERIESYQDAVSAVISHSSVDKSRRNILLCHQFITGAQMSDSEEKSLGGLDNIDASVFDDFDYVALGHIHKPQKMTRDTVRYSGSLLKYSLSEATQKKSVSVVTIGKKGEIEIRERELSFLHDVREIKGTISEVMGMPYSEDYVRVTVTDETVPPDTKVSVTTVFPNMMKFAIENSKTKTDIDILAKESLENKSITDMFIDFFRLQNNDVAPDEEYLEVFDEVLKGTEDDKYEAD